MKCASLTLSLLSVGAGAVDQQGICCHFDNHGQCEPSNCNQIGYKKKCKHLGYCWIDDQPSPTTTTTTTTTPPTTPPPPPPPPPLPTSTPPPLPTSTPAPPQPTPPPPPPPAPPLGQTKLTKYLNDEISWSGDSSKVYQGGRGIIIRSPFDGFEDDGDKTVVPATFWVNDIFAPSQMYPGAGPTDGNPWCPTDYAAWSCDQDADTEDNGPWNYAQLAAVVGTNMNKLFTDFENIQNKDWGYGVFYASDSNSVDKRCRWIPDSNGFDCPGGWIPMGEDFVPVDDKKGAGWYEAGNPYAGGGGGGAGCHFDGGPGIDQTNAIDSNGENLMGDYDCQCNYNFNEDWGMWVDNWRNNGLGGKSASWAMDIAACWMNNPRDMINLQNQMWWNRENWNDRTVPQVEYSATEAAKNRPYWGWNEIPVSREVITDMTNWDAIMIKLPADACLHDSGSGDALSCYDPRYHKSIEQSLDAFVKAGKLGVGASASTSSNVVIARETMDGSGNYFREFFCESWVSPNQWYQIVFNSDGDGACYLDHISDVLVV